MTDQSLSSPQLPIALLLQAVEAQLPPSVAGWVDRQPVTVVPVTSIDELMVYALRSARLGLDASARPAEVAARVRSDALAQAEIVGLYGR